MTSAIQDLYPPPHAMCYGCGRLNEHGHHVRSVWDGDGATARFTPRPEHMAMPGFVYGGIIASLIDCHGIGTASAASMVAAGLVPGRDESPRFVTGSLQVDFLKPTPLGPELVLRAQPTSVGERKIQVAVSLTANGVECARGKVLAVRLPESMAG
jgi:acyl-coenzyme A thioesterase PaaI-like protein